MLFFLSILLNYMTQNVSSVTQNASLTGGVVPLILRRGFAHKWQISLPLDLLKAWKRYPPLAATSEEGETRLSSSLAREFRSVWLK